MRFRPSNLFLYFAAAILILFSGSVSYGQRIAILTPDGTKQSTLFAEQLSDGLEGKLRTVDPGAAESAFRSIKVDNPFNLTSEQGKSIGTVIGSDFFLIVKTANQRRTSFARPNYYEAYAAIYLVNSRTGFLDLWHLESKTGDTGADAEKLLQGSTNGIPDMIVAKVRDSKIAADLEPEFETFDPDSKLMRPAMPYKRVKPDYTPTAFLYNVAAIVDAEVSIDAKGEIRRIEILRWAGYGLDESVIAAIRQMNWRPGERGGKPLPMRVLLRYNFTKIEKD